MLGAGLAHTGPGGQLPWQRVLGAAGTISLPPAAGGERQRRLLEAEGVLFRGAFRVACDAFWQPTAAELRALEAQWA